MKGSPVQVRASALRAPSGRLARQDSDIPPEDRPGLEPDLLAFDEAGDGQLAFEVGLAVVRRAGDLELDVKLARRAHLVHLLGGQLLRQAEDALLLEGLGRFAEEE